MPSKYKYICWRKAGQYQREGWLVQVQEMQTRPAQQEKQATSIAADPIWGYWNSFRYQVIYTAAELTTAGIPAYSNIGSLGFSIAGDYGGGNLLGYTIKMGGTTTANCAAHVTSPTTTVKNAFSYNPTPTTVGNFDMITLDVPFQWDGTSNILIDSYR